MAKVTIGGAAIEADLPSFYELEKAWRYLAVVQGEDVGGMAGVVAILGLIAVGETVDGKVPDRSEADIEARIDQLKRQMTPREMSGLRPFTNDLLVELGMAVRPGEAEPAEEMAATPSTATSTD